MSAELQTNVLCHVDNLDIFGCIPDALAGVIYLDPPSNPNRHYNVIFGDEPGSHSDARLVVEDVLHWAYRPVPSCRTCGLDVNEPRLAVRR